MSNTTITMSKIRQILKLYTYKKGKLYISNQTGIARNTVKKYINKFIDLRLTLDQIDELTDTELDDLFGNASKPLIPASERYRKALEFFPYMDKEVKKTGVTQELLWKEYLAINSDGYGHSQFNHLFLRWRKRSGSVMHIQHKAGDKMYIDFTGAKLPIVDIQTGEVIEVEVFVAILGASQMTYVEATASQKKEDFIGCCENALHFYGGVPAAIVPDNLKSAVTKSSKYEPTINEAFANFAEHYSTSILPARAYRPRDKALVEGAVKIVYTRIYATLRNRIFTSLEELNIAILQELTLYNQVNLKGRNYSRSQQFEEVEKQTLGPLPALLFEFKQHMTATAMKNGHVCLSIDKHYYSVPYQFISRKVKIIFSKSQVDIYYKYELIATHKRIKSPYNYSTIDEHLASTHRFVSDWNPEKFISWAESIGEDARQLIINILDKKQHPEMAYKSCVGILSYAKKVGKERLNNACTKALYYGRYSYKSVQNILERGLDQIPIDIQEQQQLQMPLHENIRGENYYG